MKIISADVQVLKDIEYDKKKIVGDDRTIRRMEGLSEKGEKKKDSQRQSARELQGRQEILDEHIS